MDKKLKKAIVNGLTAARIIGTFFIPAMFTTMSAGAFILAIALLFSTDALDGQLARHWKVSTIAGSLLDMGADKLFGFTVLIALSQIYPIMYIPAALEAVVVGTNLVSANNGAIGKSSQIGRIKTVLMWSSISMLFITGFSNDIIETLSKFNINDFGYEIVNWIKSIMINIKNNKETIETICKTAAITSESLVTADYIGKTIKKSNNNTNVDKNNKLFSILKEKEKLEYVKNILLDEKYYEVTKNMSFMEKLNPTKEQKEEIKKLILNYKNSSGN